MPWVEGGWMTVCVYVSILFANAPCLSQFHPEPRAKGVPPPLPPLPDLLFKQFCEFGARIKPCPSMHPAYYTVFPILLWGFIECDILF
jgi:hypothetical protein